MNSIQEQLLRRTPVLALSALLFNGTVTVKGDGTEVLGPPSIPISAGTGIVAAGTGLYQQPGTITLNVPTDSTVKQVLLYWEGDYFIDTPLDEPDATIVVNGIEITGTLISLPTQLFGGTFAASVRADITGLGLVGPGINTLTVEGLANDVANNGAGVLVIVDDGFGPSHIEVRDGIDFAYFDFSPPRDAVVPQTFAFAAADSDRVATLSMFFAAFDNALDPNRPHEIEITLNVDGAVMTLVNPLGSHDGQQWDTLTLDVNVPAGATTLSVEAISIPSYDPQGASFAWVSATLVVPEALGGIGDTVYFDANSNGQQDPGETGIAGVKVTLTSANVDTFINTGADGLYLFTDVPAGTYQVAVDLSTVPSDKIPGTCPTTRTITLAAGESYLDADFCFVAKPLPPPPTTKCPVILKIEYWLAHPELWPAKITIFGKTYTREQVMAIVKIVVQFKFFEPFICSALNHHHLKTCKNH